MYGNCSVCGKRYGEINDKNYPPCEHIIKEYKMIKQPMAIVNNDSIACPHCGNKESKENWWYFQLGALSSSILNCDACNKDFTVYKIEKITYTCERIVND
jgi:DNA-directed RNA polymerase subunit RPC12/RpoP